MNVPYARRSKRIFKVEGEINDDLQSPQIGKPKAKGGGGGLATTQPTIHTTNKSTTYINTTYLNAGKKKAPEGALS